MTLAQFHYCGTKGGLEMAGICQGLGGALPEDGEMPHFPPGDRPALPIKVQSGAGVAQYRRPVRGLIRCRPEIAQQIHHHRRAMLARIRQRQAGDGPELLLELVAAAGVQSVGARIVRPGRDFIHGQGTSLCQEKLHCQGAGVVQRTGDLSSQRRGFSRDFRSDC